MATRNILDPGDVFAGYTIERLLGIGGMGTVYRARDPELPRSVALKLLHRDLTANDYIRSRFELEAAHAASLEHPNIVTVYRRGRGDDQLWIAMQFIDSTDAAEVLREGPLPPAHAVHIVTETAKALDHAHGAGVLHRDVKPANILLERSVPGRPGRVLLADFGIAKALSETAHMTQTGMMVASLQYASPEQFDNVPLDARADVYSLGCSLFHLLTGQLPYPGSTMPQLWAGHVKAPIPKPSEVRPGLPPALDAVIERAMAKERGDRYPSCGEFVGAANAALRARPRTHPPIVNRSAETLVEPEPERRPTPEPERRPTPTPEPERRPTPEPERRPTPEPERRPPPVEQRPDDDATTTPFDLAPFARTPQPPPPQAADTADVFRWPAQVGVILLGALVCAALFTWKRDTGYSWKDGYGTWRYRSYTVYQPLLFPINTDWYSAAQYALVAMALVGLALLFVAMVLAQTRQQLAGRFARVGAALLVFALLALELAIKSSGSSASKTDGMQLIAMLGAPLLLVGCWRGLAASKRNVLWFILSGPAVIALVVASHFAPLGTVPILGEGGGGMIAGVALTATGVVLAGRRAASRGREPAAGNATGNQSPSAGPPHQSGFGR